jgi:hypothetical protein
LHAPKIVTDEHLAPLALIENRLPTLTDTGDRHDQQADFTSGALALALDRRVAPY